MNQPVMKPIEIFVAASRSDGVTSGVNRNPLPAGIIGSLSALLGFIASWLPHVEVWLRLLALVLGCTVSCVTLIQLARKRDKEKNKHP